MRKREIFKVEGDKLTRLRRTCPKCGDGIFLAEHKNRSSCGSCGYTEFKSGGRKMPEKPVKEEEKPVEKPKEAETIEKPMVEEPVPKPETTEMPPEQPKVEATEPQPESPPVEEPPKGEEAQPSVEKPVKTEKEKRNKNNN